MVRAILLPREGPTRQTVKGKLVKYGSLFSGIGGIDLGLDRAGMYGAWQVEIDPYCRKVLAKHWLGVKRHEDVREVGSHNLRAVDLIAGGFPCQDISIAGKGAGIDGERSGLWSEFARIVRELRPEYVLVENVPALLGRGIERVLGDLAESGYHAEWDCISAASVGAPHRRERVFIVAYAVGQRELPNTSSKRLEIWKNNRRLWEHASTVGADWWAVEPALGRVAHGVSGRVDRLRGLGNAVVPQVAEFIGGLIMDHNERRDR